MSQHLDVASILKTTFSSCAAWSALALLCACGGGGGGGPALGTLQGELRLPAWAASVPAPVPEELAAEMVVGEVVVWLADASLPAPDLRLQGLDLLRAPGGPVAVYAARASAGRAVLRDGGPVAESAEYATLRAASELRSEEVAAASPNWVYRHCLLPNDTHFGKQWHYPQINLPQAWDLTQGSTSVIVAVLDTGIVSAHPEFSGRIIAGIDMISSAANALDGNGIDNNPEDPGDQATPQGSTFHGTHVTGTVGANGNNALGAAGVDWNCRLMPIRVLGRGGSGSVEDIANGILFAARLANASGTLPAQRADIANMSLGGPGVSPVLQQACDAANNAGVLLVAAAGNDNTANPSSPASFASVLSVGAVDLVRARAPYSNFHVSIDLWAPGGDMTADLNVDGFPDGVLSCSANDQGQHLLAFENGTSMASPHVAGVAALVKARNAALTGAQIRQILLSTAAAGSNLPNGGLVVDAHAAVQAANGSPPAQPSLVATPTAFDFGTDLTTTTVDLENRGAGTLTFQTSAFDPAAPWFLGTLQPAAGGSSISHDRLDVTVNRTGLANGVHQTRLTLTYLDGSSQPFLVAIDFRLQVGAPPMNTDTLFVVLVDVDTEITDHQVETNAAASFRFTLGNVAAGTYLLAAGTDRDNDGFLGDDGELFGVFPSLDMPIAVEVGAGQQLADLDFALEELTIVTGAGSTRPLRVLRRRR